MKNQLPGTQHFNEFMIYCQTDLRIWMGMDPNACGSGSGWTCEWVGMDSNSVGIGGDGTEIRTPCISLKQTDRETDRCTDTQTDRYEG